MVDFIRCRGRGSRFAVLTLAALTLVGLVLVATPALAADPPASFHPDEDNNDTTDAQPLSDRFDGTDQLAHLTAVATSDTDRVDWYACPTGTPDPVTQAALALCDVFIGSDPTPNVPTGGTFLDPADEAYEFGWDIPNTLDAQTRDILVLSCTGAGTDVEGTNANCRQSLEEDVPLDDAGAAPASATTTAEITQICTEDNPVNGGGGVCEVATGGPRATVDARFDDWEHGDPAPASGFVFRATSSPDVTAFFALLDLDADADTEPDVGDLSDACTLIDTFTTFLRWECRFTQAAITGAGGPGQEMAVWVKDDTGGTNDCATDTVDCTLDSHYSAVVVRAATTISKSFSPDPPDPNANAGCQDGDTPDTAHQTNDLTDQPDEQGCAYDQFGDEFDAPYTVESTGVGGLGCPSTPHDHDGDGIDDHCHGNTDSDGVDFWFLTNPNRVVGVQTITFCFDEENTPATATNHGCADETLKVTNTMNWGTQASQVFLVYSGTGTAGDPCRTGQTQRVNRVGQRDTLIACTFDSSNNPIATDPAGTTGGRLIWAIVATQSGENVGVRFPTAPDQETHAPNGQTTTTIEAFEASSNFVCVTLVDREGDYLDGGCPNDPSALDPTFVEKRVEPVGRVSCPPPYKKKKGNNKDNKLRGTATCDKIRGKGGNDVLRGRGEDDLLIGGSGFDRCFGGPGRDRFRGCEFKKQGAR